MVKLVVGYGTPEDTAAFDEHYAGTHSPLVEKIPTLRRFEAGKIRGTPDGATAPFYSWPSSGSTASRTCRRPWEAPRGRPPVPTSRRSLRAAPR